MKIPLFRIYWDDNDIRAVTDAVKAGMYWATGPNIKKFEKMIAEYLGVKYCLVFNSGGSALYALMLSHNITKGDEIIVPSFTFIATAYAPIYVGAKPVFADVEEETFGLDPQDVLEKITPKTKAIMPIHYGGLPCKIRELKEIAEDHKLLLIEDAAESFGARIGERCVGTFGNSAIFSFCQNKVFTTSEGGCAVTSDDSIYEKLKLVRSYGRVEGEKNYFTSSETPDYVEIGFNFRMSNLLASLGISQLEKVDKNIKMRRKNAEYMTKKLSGINEILPPRPPEGYFHVYQMYTIRVLAGRETRDKLMKYLAERGIMSKVYFEPLHRTTIFKKLGYGNVRLPKTEELSSQVLTLPMYPHMKREEMDFIVDTIREFFEVSGA